MKQIGLIDQLTLMTRLHNSFGLHEPPYPVKNGIVLKMIWAAYHWGIHDGLEISSWHQSTMQADALDNIKEIATGAREA